MNRSDYFNYIERKLTYLAFRIDRRGKINLLDLNIHSETFFADLLNIIFDYNLINLNAINQNSEGIDLIDNKTKIIAQVSSTCSKQKIENTLKKKIFQEYSDFKFKFVPISTNASNLKNKSFINPHGIQFKPSEDIIDIDDINRTILNMKIGKQRHLYDFIHQELGDEISIVKVDSNLATILNILASESLSDGVDSPELNPFAIDQKIIYNDLMSIKDTIDNYKIFYHKLNEKYSEFDRQGANKSMSIFQMLRSQYSKFLPTAGNSRELFYVIVDGVKDIIINSKNYIEIPYEELDLCVNIIVVDAFIRCKIFKNPEGYSYVVTR